MKPVEVDRQSIKCNLNKNSVSLRTLRTGLAIVIALFGIFVFTLVLHPAAMDLIEYWSSAKLLLHHINPYSPTSVFALEKAQGFLPTSPLVMLNPPWALFLILPLGFGGAHTALFLWTIAAFGCVFAFLRLLAVPEKSGALALFFAPVLASLCSGQSSPFLLLGFVLFLRFHRSRPFWAGASLLLMAIKPHLFLVFWAVLLIDELYHRRFRMFAGFATALAVASILPKAFDLRIWTHYVATLRSAALTHAQFPTISMFFRMQVNPNAVWLLLVPSFIAVLWALWYYASRRNIWDWKTNGMLIMLVTVLVSPYGFFTDQVVLLPSIAFALLVPEKRKYSIAILFAINIAAIVQLSLPHASLVSPVLAWMPLAWLAWFLYTTHGQPQREASPANLVSPEAH